MYVYTVREPFGGFAKGDVLSQSQVDEYEAKGGHVDHHVVRLFQPDPPPASKPVAKAAESAAVNLA